MEIESTHINRNGEKIDVLYKEHDPLIDLEGKNLHAVHAFCFYKDNMVLVNHPKGGWGPPGGGIEEGETYEEAIVREVREETNMKVLKQKFIGFQDFKENGQTFRQVRSLCIVEPYGEFVNDPDNEIEEIKLIDPEDYKQYFEWGEIGERIMSQALEFKKIL